MGGEAAPRLLFLRHLFWVAKDAIDWLPSRLRRTAFIARSTAHALWQRAAIEFDVAGDVRFGKGVRVTVAPRTRNRIRIGHRCSLGERTLFALNGGTVVFGDWVDVRRDAVFTVAGRLSMEGRNVLQPGLGIHCDEAVTLKAMASISERTTITDSVHYFTAPEDFFGDNLKTGPIEIGYNSWIGAQATIGRNVTVGDFSVVASNALVLDDVPTGHLVSGVPAAVVKPVRLPWRDEEAAPSPDQA